ncbi:CRAL-TRIO domain-containing protein, partial [Dimargaris cristalligena]
LTADQQALLDQFTASLPTLVAQTPEADRAKHTAFCTSACLQRYLRAHKWQLDRAQTGLTKTLQWRSEYRPDEITPAEIESEAVRGKMYPNGYDLFGRSVIYMRQRLNHTSDAKMQMRYLVFTLERAVQMLPDGLTDGPACPESLSLLIDCEGWSMSTGVPLSTARETLTILGSHYPERLGHAFVVNAPWLFWTFFKIVSPFVDPVTRRKINFVDLKTQHDLPLLQFNDMEKVIRPSSSTEADPTPTSPSEIWTNLRNHFSDDYLEASESGRFNFQYNHEHTW